MEHTIWRRVLQIENVDNIFKITFKKNLLKHPDSKLNREFALNIGLNKIILFLLILAGLRLVYFLIESMLLQYLQAQCVQ